ncbi:MAG: S8 family serine peptidase [Phycisphaerales bacterium]
MSIAFAFVTLMAVAPPTPAALRNFQEVPGEREFSGELIARPQQNLSAEDRARAVALLQQCARKHYAETDEFILTAARGPQMLGQAERQLAEQLLATGLFQYVHPNWTVYPTAVPNDPRYPEQWHHVMMQCPAAWDLHTGNGAVICAVCDTGMAVHQDLDNRVPGYNAVSFTAEADGGVITDINGHGTHVAGCAAAHGNNGVGVSGMGWDLKVMPIRVSEAAGGGASYDAILAGARWAAEHGAAVVSASYSGVGYDAQETTGQYIHSLNSSFLWAAGNSGTNHAGWDYPNLLVIGASDQSDARAYFSGFGRGMDCFAPGVSILSTTMDGAYGFASGTSMATPVANGALAMVRSINPLLSAQHAEYILLNTCDFWDAEPNSELNGWGRINLARALQTAQTALVPQPPVARNDRFYGVVGQDMTLDVLGNDFDPNMDWLVLDTVSSATSGGEALTAVPGASAGERDTVLLTGDVHSAAGVRSFTYQVREPISGATSQGVAYVDLALPRPAENPVNTVPGLDVNYYAVSLSVLPDWSTLTPYLHDLQPDINFASTDGVFANSGLADDVGAVFDGYVAVPTTGLWTFSLTSDDGSRMRIGDDVVVNNDGLHGMVTASGSVALSAGLHRMRVEFFERGGGAGVVLRWTGPGLGTEAVPASALYRVAPGLPGDLDGSGRVDGVDLGLLLGAWGPGPSEADLSGDGVVDGTDLGVLLSFWTQ